MQTEAAVLVEINRPLRQATLTLPELKPGQVLVEVAYSGVCHSQLHEVRGRRGPDRFLPHTLGHEGSGTVLSVGDGVSKVKAGDRVVLTWIKGDGADVAATVYHDGTETVNSGALSTFMRHTVTCENRVVPLSSAMPLREAALLGCAVPTGAGIVLNAAKMKRASSVAVFGVGGIGLSALLAAKTLDAAPLIAVDVVDAKLAEALRLGATHAVNSREREPLAAIQELTDGRGVDYSIECAGRRETMETAFRSVRNQGGLCVLAGNLPHGERIAIDPFDLIRGKRIVGTWGGETRPDQDLPRYAQWFLEGRLPLANLITHEYPLDEINTALSDMEQGRVSRALIKMVEGG
ncbi:MAG TPA: zinc-binding dehydrogenase [Pirellulales bacterium]|nr:zinc-binding dehydrogenase [Pirellulales bacterium]